MTVLTIASRSRAFARGRDSSSYTGRMSFLSISRISNRYRTQTGRLDRDHNRVLTLIERSLERRGFTVMEKWTTGCWRLGKNSTGERI